MWLENMRSVRIVLGVVRIDVARLPEKVASARSLRALCVDGVSEAKCVGWRHACPLTQLSTPETKCIESKVALTVQRCLVLHKPTSFVRGCDKTSTH